MKLMEVFTCDNIGQLEVHDKVQVVLDLGQAEILHVVARLRHVFSYPQTKQDFNPSSSS